MSVRVANCPSCGGEIRFANAAAVMVVCPHCGTASVRKDASLEKLGRVAEIAPIESAVSLGASGKYRGRRFSVVGQVQLDHGAGPWNEWALLFEDGRSAWLAEAQGQFYVTSAREPDADLLAAPLGVGSRVSIGVETFVVAEEGRATVVTARGELPEELAPGATYEYFDLRGPSGRFGTIAVASGGDVELYLGEVVARDALHVEQSTVTESAPRRATPDRVGCPACGAPIEIRDPANAMRVVCSSCGAMTDPRDAKLRVIEKAKRLESRPTIPIGARARLRGHDFEVLAFLVRSVRVNCVHYPWREYLLKRADGEYWWLVESDGHWSIVSPVDVAEATRHRLTARYRGEEFRHFQGGDAVVDHVQGECYWEVAIGETVRSDDYVSPPRMLSFETSKNESIASLAEYVEADELAAAFPGVTRWPWRKGIAPNQPNRWRAVSGRTWKTAGALAAATIFLMIWFGATAAREVVATVKSASPAAATDAPGTEDRGVVFSDEFQLKRSSANLRVHLAAGCSNQWLGVDGALVELDTGDVRAFALQAERWSGVAEGEAWSEGDDSSDVYLGGVPAGRYALRLDAEGSSQTGGATAVPYTVTATSQVPSTGRGVALLAMLLAVPVLVGVAGAMFETRRWSTSDHPPGGGDA